MESVPSPEWATIEYLALELQSSSERARRDRMSSLVPGGTREITPLRFRRPSPTETEWERHREIITELYSRMRLTDVRHRMEVQYDFKGSRRMYYEHFERWGLRKNLKASEKDHLDVVLSQTSTPTQVPCNENIRRRIERHRKTKKSSEIFRPWTSHHPSTWGNTRQVTALLPVSCDSFLLSSSSTRTRTPSTTPPGGPVDPPSFEFVLRCIKSLFPSKEPSRAGSDPPIRAERDQPVDSFRRFWGNLGYGIHLLKVTKSTQKAFSTINQACADAPAALTSDTFTFIMGLLTTLSPANNLNLSDLRTCILRYLTVLSQFKLGPSHPLHLLCNELLYDGPSSDLCEEVLSYLLVQQIRTYGDGHSSVLRLRTSLVASKLRDGDYDAAVPLVEDLISNRQTPCEATPLSERFAVRELEQALFARDERAHSLDNCLSIIWICNTSPSLSAVESEQVFLKSQKPVALLADDTAMKIDELTGMPEARAMWLRRSAGVARALWGDCPGYREVADQLGIMLRREAGRHELGPEVFL